MADYVHLDEDGNVTERVRTVPASHNDQKLAAKAADEASGWQLDTGEQDGEQGEQSSAGRKSRRGRGTAQVSIASGGQAENTTEES